MKKVQIYILSSLLLTGLASCESEQMTEDLSAEEASSDWICMTVSIDNSTQTRAQIALGNYVDSEEYGLWNEGDSFSLYDLGANGSSTPTTADTFTITDYSDENPSSSASFTGASAISTNNRVMAVYPAQDEAPTDGVISLSIPSSTAYGANTDEEVAASMAERMFMYASGEMAGDDTDLSFNHLTSMIRLTYRNESSEAQTISEIGLTGDGKYFGTCTDFVLNDGSSTVTEGSTSLTATFDSLTVAAGDTLEVYWLFFPYEDFNDGGSLTFSIEGESVAFPTSVLQTTAFSAGGRWRFNLTKTDSGLEMTNNYADLGDYVVIYSSVNAKLCEVLADYSSSISLDDEGNAIIPASYVKNTISLSLSNKGLTSLAGLECFTNLKTLDCYSNALTSLDASVFPKLTYLRCYENALTSLDVSTCTALTTLYCEDNALTNLDVSGCSALISLFCYNNALTSLDVSGCTALTTLWCHSNALTSLDVSGCTTMTTLYCYSNDLTSLDVTTCTALTSLWCESNNLTSLDVSGCTALTSLFCFSNALTSLNVTTCTALTKLSCSSNALTSLDVSTCTALTSLYCDSNALTSLNVTTCTALTSLICSDNALTSLDVSGCTVLTQLNCYSNALTSLNVSGCTTLTILYCGSNALTSLDVSGCTALTELSYIHGDLTSLNVSGCTALTELSCYYNHLTELDVSSNTSLSSLYCGYQMDSASASYIYMTLILNSDQVSLWESSWSSNSLNKYVTVSY